MNSHVNTELKYPFRSSVIKKPCHVIFQHCLLVVQRLVVDQKLTIRMRILHKCAIFFQARDSLFATKKPFSEAVKGKALVMAKLVL